MADEKKEEMQVFTGLYVGKEARRKRVLKSGKDKDKEITVYGLKVKEREDSQFPKSFTAQSNTKGMDTIKELDWVKVGYIIDQFTNKNGEPTTSNKVMWIGKTMNPNQQAVSQPTPQNAANSNIKPNIESFDKFSIGYKEAIKFAKIEANAFHMLGSYLIFAEKEKYAEILAKCREALK